MSKLILRMLIDYVASHMHSKYFLTFIDDKFHYIIIYLWKNKSKVFEIL
jgi:hypothetical protein